MTVNEELVKIEEVDMPPDYLAVVVVDPIGLSLVTRSSYDKSWRLEMALMGKRFLCDNGLMSGEFFARVGFRHAKTADRSKDWQLAVHEAMAVIEDVSANLIQFVHGLRALKSVTMREIDTSQYLEFFPGTGDGVKGRSCPGTMEASHNSPDLRPLVATDLMVIALTAVVIEPKSTDDRTLSGPNSTRWSVVPLHPGRSMPPQYRFSR